MLDGTTTAPTSIFETSTGEQNEVLIENCDFSALAYTNLIDSSAAGTQRITFRNCKLRSGSAVSTGTIASPGGTLVSMENCDSGDTNYRLAKHHWAGVVTSETTIVKTGGASDGVTTLSHKMVSNANARLTIPLPDFEMAKWNTTVGSAITVTVDVIWDSVTNLTNGEVWLEVEYLGTSGVPLGTRVTDRVADVLASTADQTASSATWTTTGLTNPNEQKLEVTFTPQEAGFIIGKVMLGKASTTIYVDNEMVVS